MSQEAEIREAISQLVEVVRMLAVQTMQPPTPPTPVPVQMPSANSCDCRPSNQCIGGGDQLQYSHSLARFNEQMASAAASMQMNYLVQQQAGWAAISGLHNRPPVVAAGS